MCVCVTNSRSDWSARVMSANERELSRTFGPICSIGVLEVNFQLILSHCAYTDYVIKMAL